MAKMILSVKSDGEVLVLEDGTRWRVDDSDISTSSTWLETEKVEVIEREDGRHEIVRQNDGASVLASQES